MFTFLKNNVFAILQSGVNTVKVHFGCGAEMSLPFKNFITNPQNSNILKKRKNGRSEQ